MKQVIPLRIIVNLEKNGSLKDAVLQYQLNTDGQVSKPMTIGIEAGLTKADVEKIVDQAISHTEKGEKIK